MKKAVLLNWEQGRRKPDGRGAAGADRQGAGDRAEGFGVRGVGARAEPRPRPTSYFSYMDNAKEKTCGIVRLATIVRWKL